MEEHGIAPIDLVVVNLYPFAANVAAGMPALADRRRAAVDPRLLPVGAAALIAGSLVTPPHEHEHVGAGFRRDLVWEGRHQRPVEAVDEL